MYSILSVSRNTRRLLERNGTLALAGFRVFSPRTPEEAPCLALEKNVDAVVIGHSVEPPDRAIIIEAIRRVCPECIIVFAYASPDTAGEPLANVSIDVTHGAEPLIDELQNRLPQARGTAPLLQHFLRAVIDATGADFGNIQLFDSSTHSLRIVAQYGFSEEFLGFFEVVCGNDTACGSALNARRRIIVEDVDLDPIFQGSESREVMLRANVRAVQSTPLIRPSGKLLGVLSTHWRQPGAPSARRLQDLDRGTADYLRAMEEQLTRTIPAPGRMGQRLASR
jgi:hypothetical protein